jgi:mRNA-degrading endonuclease toxin of MazEF toxin-antitoxin module
MAAVYISLEDALESGTDESSVANCDGIHTVSQRRLTQRIGLVDDGVLDDVCTAIAAAIGGDRL